MYYDSSYGEMMNRSERTRDERHISERLTRRLRKRREQEDIRNSSRERVIRWSLAHIWCGEKLSRGMIPLDEDDDSCVGDVVTQYGKGINIGPSKNRDDWKGVMGRMRW